MWGEGGVRVWSCDVVVGVGGTSRVRKIKEVVYRGIVGVGGGGVTRK